MRIRFGFGELSDDVVVSSELVFESSANEESDSYQRQNILINDHTVHEESGLVPIGIC